MKFLQLLLCSTAPSIAAAAFPAPQPQPELSLRSLDYIHNLLAEASFNASAANFTIEPIHHNASAHYDTQGNRAPKRNYTVHPSHYMNSSSYQQCLDAINCEPVHYGSGWRPSFKKGYNATHPYGNGTLSRHITNSWKRQDPSSTAPSGSITASSSGTTMAFGNQNPCTAFNYAYYICGESSCSQSSAKLSSTLLVNTYPQQGVIETFAQGQYPTYEMREFLIGVIVTIASQGQDWKPHTDYYGTQWWLTSGFNDINVALYSNHYYETSLQIWTEWQPSKNAASLCGGVTGVIMNLVSSFLGEFGFLASQISSWSCYIVNAQV